MERIKIRTNGIKPENVVAEWEAKTNGGAGERKVKLGGWARNEIAARQKLFEQAKAMRDELNQAIEEMIEELCAGVIRSCECGATSSGRCPVCLTTQPS